MNMQRSREHHNRVHDPIIVTTLRILEFIALVGVIYCSVGLLVDGFVIPKASLILYGAWFILSVEATEAMIHGWYWGAALLGGSTLLITIADIVRGEATLGGAMLGILILVLIVAYVRDYPQDDDL